MGLFRKVYIDESGFTLIELLIVTAIIAILAGIAVPRLSGTRNRARSTAGRSALGTINTAMGMVFAEYGAYPGSFPWDADGDKTNDFADIETLLSSYIDNLNELIDRWNLVYDESVSGGSAYEMSLSADFDSDGNDDVSLTLNQAGMITESRNK